MEGHNNPPSDAEILSAKLAEDAAEILKRAKDLLEASGRIPDSFEDEDTAQKAAEFIKRVNTCKKALEDQRTKAKEPFLLSGRMVDTFFKAHDQSLNAAIAKVKVPLDAFTKAKVDAERKRLVELEAQKRQEAEAMAAVAVAVSHNDVGAGEVAFEDALEAELSANKLQVASQAKSGLAAVRTETGVTASIRTTWVGEVENIHTLDLEALRFLFKADDLQRALNAYVRAGGRELKGAKIWEKSETVVR
jgi:hypothetical protein